MTTWIPQRHLLQTVGRLAGVLLVAAGLVTGMGARHAATDHWGTPLVPPPGNFVATVTTLQADTYVKLTWTRADRSVGFLELKGFKLRPDGVSSSPIISEVLPGDRLDHFHKIDPNQRGEFIYVLRACASADSRWGECSNPVAVAMQVDTTPAPDLTVTRITGPQELVSGVSSVYEVVVANLGGATTKGLTLNIRGHEALELAGMETVPGGFQCAMTTTRFEVRPFLQCTGALAGSESHPREQVAIFQVRVRASGTGEGELNAYVGAENDADGSNAEGSLTVAVK